MFGGKNKFIWKLIATFLFVATTFVSCTDDTVAQTEEISPSSGNNDNTDSDSSGNSGNSDSLGGSGSSGPSNSGGSSTSASGATIPLSGYKLVWSDEFDESDSDGTPLSSKWGYDIGRGQSQNTDGTNPNNWAWGNDELQWYSDNDPD